MRIAQRTLWERMGLALAFSLALHFALVIGIQGSRPRDADAVTTAPLMARLEPAAVSEPQQRASEALPAPPVPAEPQPTEQAVTPDPVSAESKVSEQAVPKPPAAAAGDPTPAIEIPVIRDPTYYAARYLDEYPKPLDPIEPRYPEQAALTDLSGSVTLLLLIDDDGTLNEISVIEAKPESIFDEAALAAFRGVRFAPARKDGRAVRSRVLITVGFEAQNRSSAR